MSFYAIPENKILAKFSELTVYGSALEILVLIALSFLNYLTQMNLPSLISRTISFSNLGMLGVFIFLFFFVQKIIEHTVSKQ